MTIDSRPADRAVWWILASNLLTLAMAWHQGWGLLGLLWPYFIQNLVIGWYSHRRIRALAAFSTAGLEISGQAVEPSAKIRDDIAGFFALHFGIFHLVYLIFLVVFTVLGLSGSGEHADFAARMGTVGAGDALLFAGLGLAFWISHGLSHREHVGADLARQPNVGTLMLLPYARVLPMHIVIIVGMAVPLGAGLMLFGLLKTAADIGAHRLEHRWLQKPIRIAIG